MTKKRLVRFIFPFLLVAGSFLYLWLSGSVIPQIKPGGYPDILGEQNSESDSMPPDQSNPVSNPEGVPQEKFLVSKIIDGDTIILANGEHLRYIGINAPELTSSNSKIRSLAKQAKQKNSELVLNEEVILVKDVSERDKYGRLLRYVFLEDGTFVNLELVRQGFAYASAYPPDVAHQAEFNEAQQEARSQKLGLWK